MSSHLKPVLTNTLAQLTAKFVGAGLTFLTTVVIIRTVGPALFGDLTKALALIAIGFTAIDFGLNATTVRALGQSHTPQKLISGVITLRLLFSLLVVTALNLLVFALPGGYTWEVKSVFWVGSLAIIFQGIYTSINAWFQFQETYWRAALSSIVGAIFGTILTLAFVFSAPTLFNFLLAGTLGYLSMSLVSFALTRGVVGLVFSLRPLKRLFHDSLVLGGILLLSVLASKTDVIILGIFRSAPEVGQYGFSYRIFDVLLVFPTFIMNAVFPRLVKASFAEAKQLIKNSLLPLGLFSLALAAIFWAVAPWVLWVKPGLDLSVQTLRLLTLSLPLFFLTAPLMWQLITFHQEKILLRIYLLAALGNGLVNLIFVPRYGALASALITGATELFILLSLMYSSSRYAKTLT